MGLGRLWEIGSIREEFAICELCGLLDLATVNISFNILPGCEGVSQFSLSTIPKSS